MMKLSKRIWLNLKRNWGKSLILFLLIFVLASVVTVALMLSETILKTEALTRNNIIPVATIQFNYEETEDLYFVWPTREEMNEIGNLPYVEYIDFHRRGFWSSSESDIQTVTVYFEYEYEGRIFNIPQHAWGFESHYIDNRNFLDLKAGMISITQGRTFTEEELENPTQVIPIIVSNEFAKLNRIYIGAQINIDTVMRGEWFQADWGVYIIGIDEKARNTSVLEIIGIFEPTYELSPGDTSQNALVKSQMLNRFYMPLWVSQQIHDWNQSTLLEIYDWWEYEYYSEELWLETIILLNDPMQMNSFVKTANEMLPDNWEIVTLLNRFDPMTGAMESLRWLANLIIKFTIVVAVAALSLIILLGFQDRKHEIGIFMALGESKIKILGQFLTETIFIGTTAIIIAIFFSNLFMRDYLNNLMHQQIIEQANVFTPHFNPWDMLQWFHRGGNFISEMIYQANIGVRLSTISLITGYGILTLCVTSLIPIWKILKQSPKTILLEKNK